MEKERFYLRFGEIPENEISGIYTGEEKVGEEKGVSVYPMAMNMGDVYLGFPFPVTEKAINTLSQLTMYSMRRCYIVKGDYIGRGSDREPLIKNVKVVGELDYQWRAIEPVLMPIKNTYSLRPEIKEEESEGKSIWIARDCDGQLHGFTKKPVLNEHPKMKGFGYWDNDDCSTIFLDDDSYPFIKDNECVEFKVK